MSDELVYRATLKPPAEDGPHLYEIDVEDVGITQAERLEECVPMAVSLVSILNPDLDRSKIKIEFVRSFAR